MRDKIVEAAIILALIAAVGYGAYTYSERNAKIAALKDAEAQIERTVKELDTAYLLKIDQQDKALRSLESQVKVYKTEREGIRLRTTALDKQREAIHKPVNDAELRQGLEALGYKTK